MIIAVFERGVTFNEVPVFDGGTNPINVAALEESVLLYITRDALQKAIQRHPEQCHLIIERLAENLRNLIGLIEEIAFFKVPNRLARLLLRLPADHTYTQDQLAARLGTVREVVSRALRDLEKAGAIRCQRRRVEVIDRSILEIWANRPDPV
ncbi:Crp/Fnr family transcriptional regulator [bacterium]|nr:MAG: Crp/Fnr family transcriptional regulator [bacterium]